MVCRPPISHLRAHQVSDASSRLNSRRHSGPHLSFWGQSPAGDGGASRGRTSRWPTSGCRHGAERSHLEASPSVSTPDRAAASRHETGEAELGRKCGPANLDPRMCPHIVHMDTCTVRARTRTHTHTQVFYAFLHSGGVSTLRTTGCKIGWYLSRDCPARPRGRRISPPTPRAGPVGWLRGSICRWRCTP